MESPSCRGVVDRVEGLTIVGWAGDERDPGHKVIIEVLIDGKLAASAVADQPRGDVKDIGFGDGYCGFRVSIPLSYARSHPVPAEVWARTELDFIQIGTADIFDSATRLSTSFRNLIGSSDNRRLDEVVNGLRAYTEYYESQMPHSVPFSDYPSWHALFYPPSAAPSSPQNLPPIYVVLDDRDDPAAGEISRASLEEQGFSWQVVTCLREVGQKPASDLKDWLPSDGFLLFLRAGDQLHAGAMDRLLPHLAAGGVDFLYADHEVRDDEDGTPEPRFKPAWNYDLYLAQDYLASFCLISLRCLRAVGAEDDWDDLVFRAIEAADAGRIAHLPGVLASSRLHARPARQRRLEAVNRHLQRVRPGSYAEPADAGQDVLRVHWRRRPRPRVAAIIPTRDKADMLANCVETLQSSLGQNSIDIVIVDNGSCNPDTFEYFESLKSFENIRVLKYAGEFNYSAINNWAVKQTDAEIIALVNNDIIFPEALAADWIDDVVALLDRGDVGAVGIKLLYGDGRIQHGGVILGLEGHVAGHAFRQLPDGAPGYGSRALSAQQYSAVTAACLFLRRDLYDRCGGMDEKHLPVAFNDVDLCLRIGRSGLRIVWTPHVWAYHRESATRGSERSIKGETRLLSERRYMETVWARLLVDDPCYSPNLNLDGLAFTGLAFPPRGIASRASPVLRFSPGAGISTIILAGADRPKPQIRVGQVAVNLLRRFVRRIANRFRENTHAAQGEAPTSAACPLDVFNNDAVIQHCSVAGDCLWAPQSASEISDIWSVSRFCIDLLRSKPDLRERFPRALSAGTSSAFLQWLVEDDETAPVGLSPQAREHIRQAFSANLSDRVRQAYLTRQDLRDNFPLALTPVGRGPFLEWLFRCGRPEHDFREEEIWWFTLENAENPELELVRTYLFTPSWQKLFPDGLTIFGRDGLSDWLMRHFGITEPWMNARRWPRPMTPAQEICLAFRHRKAWQDFRPGALSDLADATALVEWLMTRSARLPEHVAEGCKLLDLHKTAREIVAQGVNVLGHFCYPSGLRISLEFLVEGLHRNQTAVTMRDVTAHTRGDEPRHAEFNGLEIYDISLVHVQPSASFDAIFQQAGLHHAEQRPYRIAYWYWELDSFPENWEHTVRNIDEIWVATDFVAATLRQGVSVPVHKLTPGQELPDFTDRPRDYFSLPDDKFIFMFAFHMMSVSERKNPQALIKAYRQAFSGSEDTLLVIKTSFGDRYPETLSELKKLADAEGVVIIDETLTRDETLGLINNCDCYVSLHRSEGFGLTMVEAMLMGKPVIATGYSGNLEFMDQSNSLLVDYELRTLEQDYPPYRSGSRWAEPSIDHAAQLMRNVFENRQWAEELGAKGRQDVMQRFSLQGSGRRMSERLQAIRRQHLPGSSRGDGK